MSTPADLMTPSSTPSALHVEQPITDSSFADEGQTTLSNNVDTIKRNPYSSRPDKEGERPVWSSRCAYTCGALLSVPLSQLWRGGALLGGSTSVYASLIGLVVSVSVIGLPLYVLELGWGQKYQVGALGIWQLPHFGKRKRRWTGLGVSGMLLGLVYASYTMGILAWTLHALLDTFTLPKGPENPWFPSTNGTIYEQNWDAATERLKAVEQYWVDDVVGQSTLAPNDWQPTHLLPENVANSALLWAIVGVIASLGVRHLGRISLGTTTTSLVLLCMLFVASLSISHEDNSNNDNLSSSSAWEDFAISIDQDDVLSESIVQTVYITGILVGIQTSYASYGPAGTDGEPIGKIACLIMALNVLLIFTTGYVLSSALPTATPPFYQNTIWNTGLRLVFAHWPSALSTLPGGIAWVRLLYSTLLLIGIQLPLAVVTAILAVLRDDRASTVARWKCAILASAVGFAGSVVFATDGGLVALDTLDYYLTLTLLLVAFLEAFATAWMYNLEDQIRSYGVLPVVCSILWNFAPVAVAAGVWFGLGNNPDAVDHDHRMWLGLFGGLIAFLLFFMLSFVSIRRSYEYYVARCIHAAGASSNERILHPRDYYLEFSFGNMEALKDNLESSMGGSRLPQLWYILLKRVVPHLLLLVFLKKLLMMMVVFPTRPSDNTLMFATVMAFGSYGGYPTQPYQVLGLSLFGSVVALLLLGFVGPHIFAPVLPPPTSVFINRRDTMEDHEEDDIGEGPSSSAELNLDELPDMEDPLDVISGNVYHVEIQ